MPVKWSRKAASASRLRSSGEILPAAPVVIGDTPMGELMLLYGIADLAFVGGSWWNVAVITRWSRLRHAIPVLMGPGTRLTSKISARNYSRPMV